MPSNNIASFAGQFLKGGVRPHLFEVVGSFPDGGQDEKIPFLVKAAQLPASTVGVIEVPFRGRKVKVPGDRTFAEWTVTIMNDEDFLIRNAMENWMASINAHEGNTRQLATASSSEYKSQAQITQYSKTGVPLRVYNFNGIFPTSVGAITMDWNTTDDIERFDVTFQYDWWNVDGGITGTGGTNA